jgi:hypothetical protein
VNISDVTIATLAWARTPHEEVVLGRALERLNRLGPPIALADRGDNPTFSSRIARLQNVHVTVSPAGLVTQAQASVELAARFGSAFLLYTEPDKEMFFGGLLETFIAAAPHGDDVGVVLASRSSGSFDTFPPTQRYTESVINRLAAELIGPTGDYSYGPFLMNRMLVSDVLALEPTLGWGWRHATFAAAKRRGLRVEHVSGEFCCPPDQRTEDARERRHRLLQLSQNLLGLIE